MKAKRNWLIGVIVVSVLVILPLGMAQAQDLSLWLDKWFKVTFTKTALHYPGPGVKPAPNAFGTSSGPGYIHVIGVDLTPSLTLVAYTKDPDTGKRLARPNPLSEWITTDVPTLRILDDDLWNRVKARQRAVRHVSRTAHREEFNRFRRWRFSAKIP